MFFKKKRAAEKSPVVSDATPARTVEVEKRLSDFEIGQQGRIIAISGDGKIRRRLFDMGVTPGADVFLRKRAPLGDPLEVTLRGYELTLRKSEAREVTAIVEEQVREDEQEGKSEAQND